mmetsp:Transcript_6817/g.27809  ORF Transcript_6817/g.27809 Transcript_6817/m.27809 type:complete len:282 (+) Transcript_6817:3257-4102(+)
MSEANSAKGSFVACVGGVGVVDCSKIPKASSANAGAGGCDPSSAPFVSRATGVDSNSPKASSTDAGADGVTTPGAWNMSISRGLSSIGAPNRSSIDGSGAATGRACSSPVGASDKSASLGDGDGAGDGAASKSPNPSSSSTSVSVGASTATIEGISSVDIDIGLLSIGPNRSSNEATGVMDAAGLSMGGGAVAKSVNPSSLVFAGSETTGSGGVDSNSPKLSSSTTGSGSTSSSGSRVGASPNAPRLSASSSSAVFPSAVDSSTSASSSVVATGTIEGVSS